MGHFSTTSPGLAFSYRYLASPGNPDSRKKPLPSASKEDIPADSDFYKPEQPIKTTLPSADQLEIIVTGSERGNAEKLMIYLDNQGNLYEKFYDHDTHEFISKAPYNLIGKIDPNGAYTLLSGEKGSIFSSPSIMLATGDATNTFGETLREAEARRALKNSEIPWIRKNLTEKGWDGTGVHVGIIELEADEDLPMKTAQHGLAVASIVVDPKYGVAPAAKTQFFNPGSNADRPDLLSAEATIWKNKYIPPVSDNPQDLSRRLVRSMTATFEDMSKSLSDILKQKREKDVRVLNMSIGSSRLDAYTALKDILNAKLPDSEVYQYPRLRTLLLAPACGPDGQKNIPADKVMQSAISFVDKVLDPSPEMAKVHAQYIQTTKMLADNGVILVVGTGNDHYALSPQIFAMEPGWELSDYAKSPYVISVAATDTQGTPGDQSDDAIASFSSRGDGKAWNPTVAAPGNCILMPRWTFSNGVQYGTSFAAPYVTGTIALLLQKNPGLTFYQVKDILQRSATRVPLSLAETGAGIVNPVMAMEQTPQTS